MRTWFEDLADLEYTSFLLYFGTSDYPYFYKCMVDFLMRLMAIYIGSNVYPSCMQSLTMLCYVLYLTKIY